MSKKGLFPQFCRLGWLEDWPSRASRNHPHHHRFFINELSVSIQRVVGPKTNHHFDWGKSPNEFPNVFNQPEQLMTQKNWQITNQFIHIRSKCWGVPLLSIIYVVLSFLVLKLPARMESTRKPPPTVAVERLWIELYRRD